MDNQEGPRKRQRSDAGTEDVDATADSVEVSVDDKPLVRDEIYYREDGDCVILVGRVLFKIHRFLLERDASAFSNMFSMPQENENGHANTDENPLVLYDDVDDFRALCWIIYALPTVHIQQSKLATANMQNLVSLYLISQKYHFKEHETFARDLLHQHCVALEAKPSADDNYFFQCPESRLHSLLRIVVLTEATKNPESFRYVVQKIWLQRLEKTMHSISFALGAAEVLGSRRFMAELYYLELTRMKPVLVEGSLAYAHRITGLSPHQELALYRGSWSLRCYWSNMLGEVWYKKFDCSNLDDHDCQQVWGGEWNMCIAASHSGPFDPLQELLDIRSTMKERDERRIPCAVKAIVSMINRLKRTPAVHFLGPIPAQAPSPDVELPS